MPFDNHSQIYMKPCQTSGKKKHRAPSPGKCLVDVGRGAKFKFQQLSGDFPLNHNKQKCKMLPNNNHEWSQKLKPAVRILVDSFRPTPISEQPLGSAPASAPRSPRHQSRPRTCCRTSPRTKKPLTSSSAKMNSMVQQVDIDLATTSMKVGSRTAENADFEFCPQKTHVSEKVDLVAVDPPATSLFFCCWGLVENCLISKKSKDPAQ